MRLIDADKLKEQFKDRSLEDFTYLHFIDAIDNAPTVEKRHKGEWITVHFAHDDLNCREKSKLDFVKCPFCDTIHQGRHQFCSRCGADMREVLTNGKEEKDR